MLFGVGLLLAVCSPLFSKSTCKQGWADRLARLVEVDIRKRTVNVLRVQEPRTQSAQTIAGSVVHEPVTSGSTPSSPVTIPESLPLRQPVARHANNAQAMPGVPRKSTGSVAEVSSARQVPVNASRVTPPVPVPAIPAASSSAAAQSKSIPIPAVPQQKNKVPSLALPKPASAAIPQRTAAPSAVPPAPSKQGQQHITIYFEDGSRKPLVIPSNVVLGRRPSPQRNGDVVLAVPDGTGTVSRNHARLEITAAHMWITDLGSTNGTRILNEDGEEIKLAAQQRYAIQSGVRISLGDMSCSIIMAKSRGRRS
ncbi:FHA domain-containing protein [Bifidobacterium sp. LC6]|uniref:FHA domain-containing protein n=2 Tax=Bifidobacterium colobi TaxID=2809026 RepID=A0ABS5UV52_9BIFI|nr:FHA domain-containing protein [Bifidobacterium colobi]